MKTIWKYPMDFNDGPTYRFYIPGFSGSYRDIVLVAIETKTKMPAVWVKVDTGQELIRVVFSVYATGHPIAGGEHVGSFIEDDASVWHVFLEQEKP